MPKKTDPKRVAAKSGAAAKSAATRATKTPARKSPVKKSAAPQPVSETRVDGPTFEEIQLRAYFVSEKRRNENRFGTEHDDWLEAQRQLLEERSKRRPRRSRTKA